MIVNLFEIEDHKTQIVRDNGVYRLYIDGVAMHNGNSVFNTFFDAAKFAHDIITKIDYIKTAMTND